MYHGLKEAISTLSPIIRNRLRGLPAYVLDYSDLIPPNKVEKPFLKPVIVSGPHTGGFEACACVGVMGALENRLELGMPTAALLGSIQIRWILRCVFSL